MSSRRNSVFFFGIHLVVLWKKTDGRISAHRAEALFVQVLDVYRGLFRAPDPAQNADERILRLPIHFGQHDELWIQPLVSIALKKVATTQHGFPICLRFFRIEFLAEDDSVLLLEKLRVKLLSRHLPQNVLNRSADRR